MKLELGIDEGKKNPLDRWKRIGKNQEEGAKTDIMKSRGSGILLHVTSLPSPYGIGDLGPEAYRFADFLARDSGKFCLFHLLLASTAIPLTAAIPPLPAIPC